MTYKERLNIPLIPKTDIELYSESGIKICTGYKRIVIGDRGPYIEFDKSQIIKEVLFIPDNQKWRLSNQFNYAYYIEWRTNPDNIKVYEQKRTVSYADYKIGLYYISPFDLRDKDNNVVIKENIECKNLLKNKWMNFLKICI